MRLCVRAACTIALVAAGGLAGGAAQQRADGAISGVVVDGASGAPIAGAAVVLTTGDALMVTPTRKTFQTDSQGRSVFTELAAATDYPLSAKKDGFADGAYGASAPEESRDLALEERRHLGHDH